MDSVASKALSNKLNLQDAEIGFAKYQYIRWLTKYFFIDFGRSKLNICLIPGGFSVFGTNKQTPPHLSANLALPYRHTAMFKRIIY